LLERVRSERNDALSRLIADLDGADRRTLVAAVPVLEALAERMLEHLPGARTGTA
jgi:hypothetical protein